MKTIIMAHNPNHNGHGKHWFFIKVKVDKHIERTWEIIIDSDGGQIPFERAMSQARTKARYKTLNQLNR